MLFLAAALYLGDAGLAKPTGSRTTPCRAADVTTRRRALAVAVSRRKTYVVFTWTGEKQNNPDLYVQQIGAGGPQRLTTDPANDYNPSWSPDGQTIAFLRTTSTPGRSEVWLTALLGIRAQACRHPAGPAVVLAIRARVVSGFALCRRHRFARTGQAGCAVPHLARHARETTADAVPPASRLMPTQRYHRMVVQWSFAATRRLFSASSSTGPCLPGWYQSGTGTPDGAVRPGQTELDS